MNTQKAEEKPKEEKVEVINGSPEPARANHVKGEKPIAKLDPSKWAKMSKEEKRRYIRNNKKLDKTNSSGIKARNVLTKVSVNQAPDAEKARGEKIKDFKDSINKQLSLIEEIRSQIDTEKLKTLVNFMSGTAFMDKPEDRAKAETWTPILIGGFLSLVVVMGLYKIAK